MDRWILCPPCSSLRLPTCRPLDPHSLLIKISSIHAFIVVGRSLPQPRRPLGLRLHASSSDSTAPSVLETIRSGGEEEVPPAVPVRVELPIPSGYNRVEIEYCTGCRWMLRAAWMSQELLTTFQDSIDEVALQPGRSSGVFDIRVNNQLIWSRKVEGRFPEAKEVKQRLRDAIDPDRDLGHSDVGEKKTT